MVILFPLAGVQLLRCVLFAQVTPTHLLPVRGSYWWTFFFFFFFKYVEEKSVTAAGFVPVEFIACMLQPIQTDSACSHLCTDWSIFRVSAGKSAHLGATVIPLTLFVEILL